MRMVDLIDKKRRGLALDTEEIEFIVSGYVHGDIPDYQMSAFAMAVVLRGMTDRETADLTMAMASSGATADLRSIPGIKVDKHSTGGVGDKTTLVLAPLVAAAGAPVAKMSGRGLGHTGGTIDKLESIPGLRTTLALDDFFRQVREIGIAVVGQTADLAPADKKLYALRDVTATVQSIPLIASSIMSKKIAGGADAIVLDVKVGAGAFMKDLSDARRLAQTMIHIGQAAGRRTVAVLTRMDEPLGRAVGNALEVKEAIQTLQGQGPVDLTELCLVLASEMVWLAGLEPDVEAARERVERVLRGGIALAKFREFIAAQGGDPTVVDDASRLPKARVVRTLLAETEGVVHALHAESIGLVAMRLGAGRATREDAIDPSVGLVLHKKVGQAVRSGDLLVEVHAASEAAAEQALRELRGLIEIGPGEPYVPSLVLEIMRAPGEGAPQPDLDLLAQARAAMAAAYVPYSHFPVGAALLLDDGSVVTGANVENASYGLTNCAERTAVFRFVTSPAFQHGARIQQIAVVADSDGPVAPCGACRQVLAEFCAPETPVVLGDLRGGVKRTTLGALLPYAFDRSQLE